MSSHKYQGLVTWKESFWRSEQRVIATQARGSNRELHLHVLLIATLMEGTSLAYKRHFAFNFLFFYLLSLLFLYTSFFSHLFLFISFFVILFFLLSLSSFFKVSPAIFFTHLSFLPLEGALLSPCDVEIQKIISVPNNGEKHWQVLIPQVVKSATFSGKRGTHIFPKSSLPVMTFNQWQQYLVTLVTGFSKNI